jgi:hypothetical protein
MKTASIISAAIAALVMVGAASSPASACKWNKAGWRGGEQTEVRGWKHRRHGWWKHRRRHAAADMK